MKCSDASWAATHTRSLDFARDDKGEARDNKGARLLGAAENPKPQSALRTRRERRERSLRAFRRVESNSRSLDFARDDKGFGFVLHLESHFHRVRGQRTVDISTPTVHCMLWPYTNLARDQDSMPTWQTRPIR